MALVRTNAFAIRGLPVPPLSVPAPPKLAAHCRCRPRFRGRAPLAPPTTRSSAREARRALDNRSAQMLTRAFAQYRPLFADESAPAGNGIIVSAPKTAPGISEPSNIVGPVNGRARDTCGRTRRLFKSPRAGRAAWQSATRDCRKAKEDARRAAGNAGDVLVYQLADCRWRAFASSPFSRRMSRT